MNEQRRLNSLFESDVYMAALPVAHRINGKNNIIGSASYIMPGVFLTAKHLVDEWFAQGLLSEEQMPQATNEDFGIDLLHLLKDKELIVWRIRKIHYIPDSDLALMIAQAVDGDRAKELLGLNLNVQLDVHIPKIGENVMSLGYPNTISIPETGRHQLRILESRGVVEDIHLKGAGLIKSACIQTNLIVDGGMSGGPVFNKYGRLCGINSSGIPPTDESSDYTSFASVIFKIFHTEIEMPLESETLTRISLAELARQGYITVTGMDHFKSEGENILWHAVSDECSECPGEG